MTEQIIESEDLQVASLVVDVFSSYKDNILNPLTDDEANWNKDY